MQKTVVKITPEKMPTLYPIILAGGSGMRLWPLSRKNYPKQFIKLRELDNISLFQKSLERAKLLGDIESIRVITNPEYLFNCLYQAEEIDIRLRIDQVLVQPSDRGTLAAITFALSTIPSDGTGIILSSDHIIEPEYEFVSSIKNTLLDAQNSLVIFGIQPTHPHTGYGYIHTNGKKDEIQKVERFKEKPNKKTAEEYIQKGYYWNAGIFLLSHKVYFQELRKIDSRYAEIFLSEKSTEEKYNAVEANSIDYGLLEHSDNILMSPLSLYWNDLGSFDAIDNYLGKNEYKSDAVIEIESQNNLILTEVEGKKVVLIGVENLLIVDTKDALLISKKGRSERIKDVVNILNEEKSLLTEIGTTVYRPWGTYTIIDEGVGFKTKRITVFPGKKLSLQLHNHRSEHWVVVSGEALATINEEEKVIGTGESMFVPKKIKHRLENRGTIDLHIIESQIGDYLEEDDIVRFDDMYGRIK